MARDGLLTPAELEKTRRLFFELETPLEVKDGTTLQFELRFSNNGQHSMGRLRLSTSSKPDPPVAVGGGRSDSLNEALAALESGSLKPET